MAMRDPAQLTALLGVELEAISGLAASERGDAKRVRGSLTPGVVEKEKKLRAVLGDLGSSDAYWIEDAEACSFVPDAASSAAALAMFPSLELYMTRAKYDAAVDTEALVALWNDDGLHATIDEHAPADAARPGVLTLEVGGRQATLRFPKYASGHEVAMDAPDALAADVKAWLEAINLLR